MKEFYHIAVRLRYKIRVSLAAKWGWSQSPHISNACRQSVAVAWPKIPRPSNTFTYRWLSEICNSKMKQFFKKCYSCLDLIFQWIVTKIKRNLRRCNRNLTCSFKNLTFLRTPSHQHHPHQIQTTTTHYIFSYIIINKTVNKLHKILI